MMLRYFWKNLKPSILAKLEHQNLELESFNQIVKKVINAEAKIVLQPYFSTKKIDQNCSRNFWLANFIVGKS